MYYVTRDKGEVATSEISSLLMKDSFKQTFLRVFQVFLLILLNVTCWSWGPGSLTAATFHHSGGSVARGWQAFSQNFHRNQTLFTQFIHIRSCKHETFFFETYYANESFRKVHLWKCPDVQIHWDLCVLCARERKIFIQFYFENLGCFQFSGARLGSSKSFCN